MDPQISRSRLEINFIRLLEETQQMANGNKQKDWTFEKYIGWLQEKIPEMEKSPNAPNEEKLKHYKRQVDFLRGVLETEKCVTVLDSGTATQMIPHGQATTSDHILTQQIHQRTQAKTTNRLRQDLLGLDPSSENGLRSRQGGLPGDISSEDFQNQLLSDEQKREKMVEDMITMTREWKEQSKIANKIIKKDIDALDKSTKLADSNLTHLKVETHRLEDFNKRACNFWIWIMIIFVCFTFIGMVVFIRIFPRK
ncbi:vesicle transport protein USE1 isoform X2 [Procambarus clarkii]|uniref:vesicle transport protein USE1 isoform X2 n=1 Tax=Procambarus clarkii TaxID=6728 RepID=UPI001E675DDF|nr:vesicle transport protein USE1-like isoform X2 [Procambarus clarkii]